VGKRVIQAAVVLFLLFAVAQLIRPQRANPTVNPRHAIAAHVSGEVAAILDRSCGDCHSYRTTWPGYAQIAPLSWLYAYSVDEARRTLNFSEWSAYSPDRRRALLTQSCQAASQGRMPGSAWTALHPEAALSPHDIELLCAAAQAGEGASR